MASPAKRARDQRHDAKRHAQHPRWYNTARWLAIRAHQLALHPLCAMCLKVGRYTAATTCDHVERHNWDPVKFWRGPFQSLCDSHHSADKQREERRGYSDQIDPATGLPLDPKHPFNR